MKSMLICEGSTDSVLIQYFMRNTYQWEDTRESFLISKNLKHFVFSKKKSDYCA